MGGRRNAPVTILSPGGHGRAAIPVPIPNTEVKRPSADGTASRGRVGRRQVYLYFPSTLPQGCCFFLACLPNRFYLFRYSWNSKALSEKNASQKFHIPYIYLYYQVLFCHTLGVTYCVALIFRKISRHFPGFSAYNVYRNPPSEAFIWFPLVGQPGRLVNLFLFFC